MGKEPFSRRTVAIPKRLVKFWVGGVALVVVSSAGAGAVANLTNGHQSLAGAEVPGPSPNPTIVPTDTPTATPTETATPTSTPTPVPTPTPTVVPVRPPNGKEFVRAGDEGPSTLTVTNGTTQDAIIRLVNKAYNKTEIEVYIVSEGKWTISGIHSGTYDVRFSLGNDFDPVLRRFQRNQSYSQFDDPFPFEISDGQYTTWTITLNPVPGGTATTTDIDQSKFFSE